MKLERLLGITIELMSKKRVTATELAARFEVSVRTIYRDLDLINEAGIPVVSFSGVVGGFELMDGYYLSKQHFSIDDMAVIFHLLKGMEEAVGNKITSIVHKLGSLQPALLNGGSPNPIIIDASASVLEKDAIKPLYEAIGQQRTVKFSYTDSMGNESERSVEPARLYWDRGWWYVEGHCLLKQAQRCFKVSRMTSLQMTDRRFTPKLGAPDIVAEEPVRGIEVHLRFDATNQPRIFEQFQGQCTHLGTHIDVHTIFFSQAYALSVILSFGPIVEIVSPEELRQELLNQLDTIRARYENN
ncbi:YafY family transcriptional regulator [Paenibacillus pinisoli]|uniref:YafY family transcriptional regulator n=1 Tax=Paenibacillus pinisoli TaxID=1276110 RepID=A0A3A6PXB4_9BACL|nr:YafY family protein [Paenibacillus pinisoli]RJX41481.1 YafY family transcriptional regulator [Paenibacillus pinisoli]